MPLINVEITSGPIISCAAAHVQIKLRAVLTERATTTMKFTLCVAIRNIDELDSTHPQLGNSHWGAVLKGSTANQINTCWYIRSQVSALLKD